MTTDELVLRHQAGLLDTSDVSEADHYANATNTLQTTTTPQQDRLEKLANRKAEKLKRIRPEAESEVSYQLQDILNPIQHTWNNINPFDSLDTNVYEREEDKAHKDYGREFKLDPHTGERIEGGKYIDGEWQRGWVEQDQQYRANLQGNHDEPIYVRTKDDELYQTGNKFHVQGWDTQKYKDAISALDEKYHVTLDEELNVLKDSEGNVLKDDPTKTMYLQTAADGKSVKPGLSLGYVKHGHTGKWVRVPEEARYIPGLAYEISGGTIGEEHYGWEPGEEGVDTQLPHSGNVYRQEDAVLREGLVHQLAMMEGNQTNRKQPWHTEFDPADVEAYGSGKSEYQLGTGEVVGDKARGAELLKELKGSDNYIDAMYAFETKDTYNKEGKEGLIGEGLQTVKAIAAALPKGAIDLVDSVQELVTYPLQAAYNAINDKDVDIDLFDDKNKEELKQKINRLTGYDEKLDSAQTKKALRQLEAIGVDLTDKDTWHKLAEPENLARLGKATTEMLTNPSLILGGMAEIVGAGGAMSGGLKVAAKVGSKVAPKITTAVQKAFTTKVDKLNKEVKDRIKAGTITREQGINKLKELRFTDKLKKLTYGNSMSNADFINRMNNDITEFKKNNANESMDVEKLVTTAILNKVAAEWSAYNIKTITTGNGYLTDAIKNDVVRSGVKLIADYAKSVGKEAPQEMNDALIEVVNQNYGSKAYEDKTLADVIGAASDEILLGMVSGAAGGIQMKLPGDILKAGKSTVEIKQKASAQKRAEEMKVQMDATVDKDTATLNKMAEDGTLNTPKRFEGMEVSELDSALQEEARLAAESIQARDAKGQVTLESAGQISKEATVEQLDEAINKLTEVNEVYGSDSRLTGLIEKAEKRKIQLVHENTVKQTEQSEADIQINKDIEEDANLRTDAVGSAIDASPDYVKELSRITKIEDPVERDAAIEQELDVLVDSMAMEQDSPTEKKVQEQLRANLKRVYLSGMSAVEQFGEEVLADIDWKSMVDTAKNRVTLANRTKEGSKATHDVTEVTDDMIAETMETGFMPKEIAEIEGLAGNSKVASYTMKHYAPGSDNTASVAISEVGKQVEDGISKVGNEKIEKIFGKNADNKLKRGVLLLINRIDASVQTDTDQRAELGDIRSQSIDLGTGAQKDQRMEREYWANLDNVIDQVAKDFVNSYGMRFKGKSDKVTDMHREIGKLLVEVGQEAGLIRVSETDMLNPINKDMRMKSEKGDYRSVAKAGIRDIQELAPVVDKSTGKNTYLTRGVQLADGKSTRIMGNKSKVGGRETTLAYESSPKADAVKRFARLLLPGNYVGVRTSKGDSITRANENMTQSDKAKKSVKSYNDTPLKFKGWAVDVLKQLRDRVNSEYGGDVQKMLRGDELAKNVLAITPMEAQASVESSRGQRLSKIEAVTQMIDNIDTLENEYYVDFQQDGNNRITLMQTLANYQFDKNYARQMTTQSEPTVTEMNQKKMEILAQEMLDELGLDVDSDMVSQFIDKFRDGKEIKDKQLNDAANLADKVVNGITLETMQEVAKSELGKRPMHLMSLLEGLNDIGKMKDGKLTTQYLPGFDAKASGVLITMLDIVGVDDKIPALIEELGIQLDDNFEFSEMDAYKLLQKVVKDKVEKGSEIDILLDELKAAGMNERELAKYVVMTWFYAAGEDTITTEFKESIVDNLLEKAANGDTEVLAHLNNMIGTEVGIEIEASSIQHSVEKKQEVYNLLISKYDDIAKLFHGSLDEAFPGVKAHKETIDTMHTQLAKLAEAGAWDMTVPSPLNVVHGTTEGTVYLGKERQIYEGVDDAGVMKTSQKNVTNMPSGHTNPTHAKDAAGMFAMLDKLVDRGSKGFLATHDEVRTDLDSLIAISEVFGETTVKLAKEHDSETVMLNTLKEARDKLKTMIADGNDSRDLAILLRNTEAVIEKEEPKVAKRLKDKLEILKNAIARDIFGVPVDKELVDKVKEDEVKSKVKKRKTKTTGKAGAFKDEIKSAKIEIVAAHEALSDGNGVVIDIETTLDGDKAIHQIGYTTKDGSDTILIELTKEQLDEYKGTLTDEEIADKGLMTEGQIREQNKGKVTTLAKGLEKFNELVKDKVVIGYNTNRFDLQKLAETNQEGVASIAKSIDIFDVMKMSGTKKGTEAVKQTDLAKSLGIGTEGAHEAAVDTKMLADIVTKLAETEELNMVEVKKAADQAKADRKAKEKADEATKAYDKFKEDKSVDNLMKLVKELGGDILPGKVEEALDSGVKILHYGKDDKAIAKLDVTKDNRDEFNAKVKEKKSFAMGDTIIIGLDNEPGYEGPVGLVDTIAHEIEHTFIDNYIDDNPNDANVQTLIKVLTKLGNDKELDPRSRLAYAVHQENKLQGVKELVAISREPNAWKDVSKMLGKLLGFVQKAIDRLESKVRLTDSKLKSKAKAAEDGKKLYNQTLDAIEAISEAAYNSHMASKTVSGTTNANSGIIDAIIEKYLDCGE